MEMQTIVEYEIVEPMSNEMHITYDYYEALDCFEKEWTVYERHITTGNPSLSIQTRQIVTITWNNNPEFEEQQYEYD